ncbi:MAG: glycoside hydrolase family 55 protein [Pisciglobus halotolerans]|nr:glycoside hydrolase family 55 protein [Pisciglobus halotolerans]
MTYRNSNLNKIGKRFPEYLDNHSKRETLQETEKMFRSLKVFTRQKKKVTRFLYRAVLTKPKTDYTFSPPVVVDEKGNVRPYWKGMLDHSMQQLDNLETVSVQQFGAVGDGEMDCTRAFKAAIGNGNRRVMIPKGVYQIREIELPSYTELTGAGKDKTILKLSDSAPKKERIVTNKHHLVGNHHIRIKNMTLDWNVERFNKKERTAAGGTTSSGITLAHVKFAVIQNVAIINPGLHGVDVTSVRYNYFGDGKRSVLGSQYVWVDEVEAAGFGDDGITTHHSDDLLITNSYLHHPSGRAHKTGFSNSNGIEVDDGSQHVVLANNRTECCFGGIEIKAHQTSSAASDTQVIGHDSFHDNRAYNFRHIGHHHGKDKETQSAYGIRASYLAAYHPQKTELYKTSSPRAIVISAYQKVVINHFFAEMNENDSNQQIAIAIQYRAGNVQLRNVVLKRYKKNKSIYVAENTNQVTIQNKKT